jgi:hypothetical protein
MLRDLLVRVSAGLLSAAIAVSCSHDEEKRAEPTSTVAEAVTLAGAGGAAAGAPAVPAAGAPDAGGAGGAPPKICIEVVCELAGACMHCDGNNDCVPYQAAEKHQCRAASDECDVADSCAGGNDCPILGKVKDAGTPCGTKATKICDKDDTCDGVNRACTDSKQPKTTVCRPKKAGTLCDLPDFCDNANDDCPVKNNYEPATTICRPKAADCDADDFCTGLSEDCPAKDDKVVDGSDCADSTDKCLVAGTTKCAAGKCSAGTAVACKPSTNQCLQDGVCNSQTGCQYAPKADKTTCDDGILCSVGDQCVGGLCVSGKAVDTACPAHTCAAVTCDLSATQIPDRCKNVPVKAGVGCRGAAVTDTCDVSEVCDGSSLDCPDDAKKPMGTVCLAATCAGLKEQAELTCDGKTNKCPAATPVSCGGYACGASTCLTSCDNDAACDADHYCVNHTCELRTGKGESCKDDTQCSKSNPRCVDGVCCDTACTGQCEACDVKGSEGQCSVVTGPPHAKRTACRGDGSSCNGVCGGKLRSACDFPSPQTVCLQASCDPTTDTAMEQAFCDGAGKCATTDPMDCTPFTCSATACRGNCVTDAQCIAGAYCKAGICEDLEKPGTKCARDQQCASGFCTDGVCCEGRCDGQCEACGSGGKCAQVTGTPAGARPACAGDAGDACAGACDGSVRASCVYPAAETVCGDAACDAGKASVVAHCSGGGACAKAQTVTCPNGCEGTICAGDACVVSSDCKDAERCIAGTCAALADDGAACSTASDCSSGFCVDGACCDRACDGQCEACDGAKAGACAPVSGAPHGGRVQCTSDGTACAGACDGKEPLGCRYPSGTACNDGACTPGQDGNEAVATVEASCNGTGRCPASAQQACGGFGCDAKKRLCNGDCADGSACPDGKYCSAGVCVTARPTGSACQAGGECASGYCVDGYCCGSACDDRCAACDVPGSLGKCSPVSGATHGGRAACQGGGVCGSQCDGKSVTDCAFPDQDTRCGDPYCSSGTQVAASSCDGMGQCKPGEQTACASFACDGAECSDACKTDADCTRSLQCHDSKCVEPYKINAVDEGTCGCRAPGGHPSGPGGFLALAAISLLSFARRRRAQGVICDS